MKAVILAGGKGTRLGSLTKDIPKPMVLLAGKPLVQYQVELCSRSGIEEIIFIVNHLGSAIANHFLDGKEFGIPISYHFESEPLGTVGGLVEIKDRLTKDFLVLYGDVMMEMDLGKLIDFHRSNRSEATLVVHPNDHPYDSDLIELDEDHRVIKVLPKPHPESLCYHNMVNAAVYVFSPRVFDFLEAGVKADFGKDIFPVVFNKLRMFGYNTPEYLKDMGTPDRLKQVEYDVKSGKPTRRNLKNPQRAIFLDRDGVLNVDTDLIHRPEDLELYPFAADSIRKINASDYLSILCTNQSVVARNLTDMQGLGEIHKKMETELGRAGAKLDDIRFCPHHPHKGFSEENKAYKIDCHCRKPKPGMLTDAAKLYNIDLAHSWMIGDSERDTLAGKAAGCTTVGVMTGHGQKKAHVLPDYFFANVKEAVDFILTDPWRAEAEDCKKKYINWRAKNNSGSYVIAIAGNSRSGKSSFARKLQQLFKEVGVKVENIHLDDWIRAKDHRMDRDEVMYNFQVPQLEKDLESILSGASLALRAYQLHPSRPERSKTYQFHDPDVVIIEGVVALATEKIRSLSQLKIFMRIDEDTLKRRFDSFYRWKGMSEEEIIKLWALRLANEFKVIARHDAYADLVISDE